MFDVLLVIRCHSPEAQCLFHCLPSCRRLHQLIQKLNDKPVRDQMQIWAEDTWQAVFGSLLWLSLARTAALIK